MGAIEACRTAALGGHVERCESCAHERIAYNSCRNRHCTKCQWTAARDWLEARQADLLPVPYFHVVFTLPPAVATIAYHNKAVVYAMLFEAAAETLKTISTDKRHLGAEIGATMVLHTWGQTLMHHPHVHCIVPGGGLAPGKDRWIACRPRFFLPVRVLSRRYRRVFLDKLIGAHRGGKLRFSGDLAQLTDASAFESALAPLRRTQWLVYAKPPFAGPDQVLSYLARYTHRVAISNRRLVGLDDASVSFAWRDYRDAGHTKRMTLEPHEFMRRFLLHVLPDGFQRIRHYGFLANGHRRDKLTLIRKLLDVTPAAAALPDAVESECADAEQAEPPPCPCCGGRMLIVETFPDPRRKRLDSS